MTLVLNDLTHARTRPSADNGESHGAHTLFPYDRYEHRVEELKRSFQAARPYPHLLFDGFLDVEVAKRLVAEFPRHADAHWVRYRHVNENKASINRWDDFPPSIAAVLQELNSERFVALVSRMTGIDGLLADPDLDAAGMHQAWTGGFLNVHTDFTMHRLRPHWRRRCNLIVYLNEHWQDEWRGAIELWSRDVTRCERSMPCTFNRALLFDTSAAPHGFPEPLQCPETESRKSLQLYYYTIDPSPDTFGVPTIYYSRPHEKLGKRLLVQLDNVVLRLYDRAKRRLGLSDAVVSRLMAMFRGYGPR